MSVKSAFFIIFMFLWAVWGLSSVTFGLIFTPYLLHEGNELRLVFSFIAIVAFAVTAVVCYRKWKSSMEARHESYMKR